MTPKKYSNFQLWYRIPTRNWLVIMLSMNSPSRHFVRIFALLIQLLSGTTALYAKTPIIDRSKSLVEENQTICVIGDSGSGDNNAIAVSSALESMDCNQIRILGDIVYPSGIESAEDPLLQQNLLKPYQYFLKKKIPIFLILGNHDHKQNSTAWLKVAQQYPALKFPNFYYAEDRGEVCFINLDTSYYEKVYFMHERQPQTAWLRKTLKKMANSCKFSIGTGHHPYRSSGSHGDASWLLSLFFEDELIGKIDLYLSGHDHHLSDEGTVNGTRLLISGAGGGHKYKLKEPSADKQFAVSKYGFLTLQFSHDPKENVVAQYRFYSLIPDGKGGYTNLKQEWTGSIKGHGIRDR